MATPSPKQILMNGKGIGSVLRADVLGLAAEILAPSQRRKSIPVDVASERTARAATHTATPIPIEVQGVAADNAVPASATVDVR